LPLLFFLVGKKVQQSSVRGGGGGLYPSIDKPGKVNRGWSGVPNAKKKIVS